MKRLLFFAGLAGSTRRYVNTTITRQVAVTVVLLLLTAAALASWLAPLGNAFDQVNEKPAPLGLVGLSGGQTLRISVANVVGLRAPAEPDKACSLLVGFVDPQNRTYGVPDTFELRPGVARSFDFVADGDGSVREYVAPGGRPAREQRRVPRGRDVGDPRPRGARRDHRLRLGCLRRSLARE